jgi:hypothetical protein
MRNFGSDPREGTVDIRLGRVVRRAPRVILVSVLASLSMASFGASPASAATCSSFVPPGNPCAVLSPAAGSVGARVSLTAHITQDLSRWRDLMKGPTPLIILTRQFATGCEVQGGTSDTSATVASSGELRASFVVAPDGPCAQQDRRHAISPGTYHVSIGCISCTVGAFEVTGASATLPFTGAKGVARHLLLGGGALAMGVALLVSGRRRKVL